ncbi:MAG: SDR family NAD(P)-dependent oxidoreductase [Alistipes sp.]|nr:SDR family NAD(P)-dependent oxidoreductase [Alistipes sp.]
MKCALITGASSGMGLEYARQLAAMGYNIVAVSNDMEGNRRVAEELAQRYGIWAESLYADLSQPESAQQIYEKVTKRGLEVEILISNAGMLLFSLLENTPEQNIEKIISLHCTTPTLLCRLFAHDMRRRGRGRILIMSSITAWTPYPTISLYAATKVYLKNFGQSLWYEMRDSGVSVTTVFPSAVDTPFYTLNDRMRRRLRRWGLMMSAEQVVRKAIRAMMHSRRRCLPGIMTKIEAGICAILPACALLPILKLKSVRKILEGLS